ncbi:MAG: peptidoglycan DD-metalloendopeptidase family protein [Gammaproteobacteria bacterium]|nr:peptidoglycan DD-metalloendopeptidase family protein [Gammaproteobacteria bacterium]
MTRGKVPVSHLYVCAALAVTLVLISSFYRDVSEAITTFEPDPRYAEVEFAEPEAYEEQPAEPEPATTEEVISIAPGESLSTIFEKKGLPPGELQRILASDPLAERLHRVYPGHKLTFLVDEDGLLLRFVHSSGPLERLVFERDGGTYSARKEIEQPTIKVAFRHATIKHSLFVAAQRAGLEDALTTRLAEIFQWDIDFLLDIREGDEFFLLFEERYLDDQFIDTRNILAAQFVTQGETHRAVRYVDDEFYSPEGESMRKDFLRAPLEFTRISSNFNLRRHHPLFKISMPHRGIDYAAPVGTPVRAAGDGTVRVAGRTTPNGNYVILQHGETFETKYLHLSRIARGIRKGTHVKQGKVIGYVGATGYATGPHLHYEFLVNGVHRNPRTVELPKAKPIPASELPRFERSTAPLLAQLDSHVSAHQVLAAR